jgi:hypothetical protein
MKLKSLALAAALSVAGINTAHADIASDLGIYGNVGTTFFSSLPSYAAFYSALTSYDYGSIYGFFGPATSTTVGVVPGTSNLWSALLEFNTSTSTVYSNGFVVNTAGQTVTPVPGPEAGAGLGALAMGGMAFWMARRRKQQPIAA